MGGKREGYRWHRKGDYGGMWNDVARLKDSDKLEVSGDKNPKLIREESKAPLSTCPLQIELANNSQ